MTTNLAPSVKTTDLIVTGTANINNLNVTGTTTIANLDITNLVIDDLEISELVATDANKKLVSIPYNAGNVGNTVAIRNSNGDCNFNSVAATDLTASAGGAINTLVTPIIGTSNGGTLIKTNTSNISQGCGFSFCAANSEVWRFWRNGTGLNQSLQLISDPFGANLVALQIATDGKLTLNSTINNITFTPPASTSTLTLGSGKTITANNTVTFNATDGAVVNFGAGGTVSYGGGGGGDFTYFYSEYNQTVSPNVPIYTFSSAGQNSTIYYDATNGQFYITNSGPNTIQIAFKATFDNGAGSTTPITRHFSLTNGSTAYFSSDGTLNTAYNVLGGSSVGYSFDFTYLTISYFGGTGAWIVPIATIAATTYGNSIALAVSAQVAL